MNAQRLKWIALLVAAFAAMPACAQHGPRGMSRGGPEREAMQRYYERQGGAGSGQEAAWQDRRMMSIEERRQLRRDIHDAGRELYRPHSRRAVRADETVPAASR